MTTRTRRWFFLVLFAIAIVVVLRGIYWVASGQSDLPGWARPLVDGYGGNLSAEIVGGILFLLLALFLDAQTEEKIDHIREVTLKSEATLAERERILRNERIIRQFEDFARREAYHDVRFPDLGPAPGLEYTIEPVRDPVSGQPRMHETEMDTSYLVRVRGPAQWEVLSEEARAPYAASPIRCGEFYFCQFFNESWQMASSSLIAGGHPFYLSGKVGPVEFGQSANAFAASLEDPFKGMERVAHLLLRLDGTPMKGSGGCDSYDIYKDPEGGLFLQAHDSPPKKIYLTNPRNSVDDSNWSLEIADISGHASGQKLENIKAAIREKLALLNLEPPKVWWHEADEWARYRS